MPQSNRIVFMGDSITKNWANQDHFAKRAEFVGRGISSQTAQQMVMRFQADVVRLRPLVVHIMGGTNDIAENTGPETDEDIEAAITSMVKIARSNSIKVILASIPPAASFGWKPGSRPAERIQRLNAWLKTFAASNGLVYADYWSVLSDGSGGMKQEYSQDGVHPNTLGYQVMIPILSRALDSALREQPTP
jgi:lysophospholipase L1-like esterase